MSSLFLGTARRAVSAGPVGVLQGSVSCLSRPFIDAGTAFCIWTLTPRQCKCRGLLAGNMGFSTDPSRVAGLGLAQPPLSLDPPVDRGQFSAHS